MPAEEEHMFFHLASPRQGWRQQPAVLKVPQNRLVPIVFKTLPAPGPSPTLPNCVNTKPTAVALVGQIIKSSRF